MTQTGEFNTGTFQVDEEVMDIHRSVQFMARNKSI
jgi:tetrahydromethanopterin S-methyltransferase subunit F